MNTKHEFMAAIASRLPELTETERDRLLNHFEEMLDDRIEMGMAEADAVAALGDIDALIRDNLPTTTAAQASDDIQYSDAITEIRLHVKNADAEIISAPLPDGMTAQLTASERDAFTWSLEGGVLSVQEASEARRGLFKREKRLTIRLDHCRLAKLIADSYGGDIAAEGVEIGELAVLASSSGDISLRDVRCGGRTEVTTRSGDMRLTQLNVNGDCKLEAMSGDIDLQHIAVTSLRLRAASGDVAGCDVRANTIALGTTSGDIEVSGLSAETSLLCETTGGDVALDHPTCPDIRLSTGSGDITLRLPNCPEGYDIQAQSRSGEVRLPSPAPAGDARRVRAVSVSGDIGVTIGE